VAFPLGIIFHAILIQVMISRKKEPILFWLLLALNSVTLLISPKVLLYFVAHGDIPDPLVFDPYYLLDIILYWLLFNLVVFYGLLATEHYIKQVNGARIKIEQQKEELTQLNQNLEQMVHERTKTLEDQNKKLISYAFYNAHMLQAPFCRIQGLVQLIELTSSNNAPTDHEIEARLIESVTEMEQVIDKMRQIIQSEIIVNDEPETENELTGLKDFQ
jgi:signal transduction histidine kinase